MSDWQEIPTETVELAKSYLSAAIDFEILKQGQADERLYCELGKISMELIWRAKPEGS